MSRKLKPQFQPLSEPTAPVTPNPTTNPPLKNPATPGEDDSKGMLVDQNVEPKAGEPNEIEGCFRGRLS